MMRRWPRKMWNFFFRTSHSLKMSRTRSTVKATRKDRYRRLWVSGALRVLSGRLAETKKIILIISPPNPTLMYSKTQRRGYLQRRKEKVGIKSTECRFMLLFPNTLTKSLENQTSSVLMTLYKLSGKSPVIYTFSLLL